MDAELLEKAKALPLGERIAFADALFQSALEEGYCPEPTPEQLAELEKLADELATGNTVGIPWEQVKAEMLAAPARCHRST